MTREETAAAGKRFAEEFWNTVKRTLREKNIHRKAFCSDIGIKEKTFSAMLCRSQCPDIFLLTRIRNALGVEVTRLLYSFDSDDERVPLSPKEKKLIELVRNIPADKQAVVIDTVLSVLDCIKSPSSAENTAVTAGGTTSSESTFRRVELTGNQSSGQPESAPQTPPDNPPQTLPPEDAPAPRTQGTASVRSSSAGKIRKGRRTLSSQEQAQRWRERATQGGQILLFDD